MIDDAKTLRKIQKVKKENKKLQELLECAENEMKSILAQSQEESKQLQKVFQAFWPRIQNRISSTDKPKASKGVQTENSENWAKHLKELESCLKDLESQALGLMNAQSELRNKIEEEKVNEKRIQKEMEDSQQVIVELESSLVETKKKILVVQEENHLVHVFLDYESLAGCPPSSIIELLDN